MDEPSIPHTMVGLVLQGNAVTGIGLCSAMKRESFSAGVPTPSRSCTREGDSGSRVPFHPQESHSVPAWGEQQNRTRELIVPAWPQQGYL